MLNGAHAILYSRDADKDRAFLRDILGLSGVDVGHGWLIFGLPPAEVAVHPGEANDEHELYLMCDDVEGFVAEMGRNGVSCSPIQAMGWGMLTQVRLPGGGRLGVYQPRHARPEPMRVGRAKKAATPSKKRAASAATRRRKPAAGGRRPVRRRAARR